MTSTSPPGNPSPPGHLDIWAVKLPSPSSKNLFKCPTCKTRWMGKCPNPWAIVFYRSKQYAIFKVPELVFFILKLEKGIFLLTFETASLSFYDPFVVSHSVTSAIAKSLKHFRFSLVFGSMMTVVYDRSNSPPSAAWCQMPHLTQRPYFPGKGAGVSNARGMPSFFFGGGGEGGMLRL